VGGLLQLPSPSRRSRRPNTLRALPPESPRPTVIGLRSVAQMSPKISASSNPNLRFWKPML
jgi:hypothetical protein